MGNDPTTGGADDRAGGPFLRWRGTKPRRGALRRGRSARHCLFLVWTIAAAAATAVVVRADADGFGHERATGYQRGLATTSSETACDGIQSGSACCTSECGECGGVGCADRVGGAENCCAWDILERGALCSNTGGAAPCVVDDPGGPQTPETPSPGTSETSSPGTTNTPETTSPATPGTISPATPNTPSPETPKTPSPASRETPSPETPDTSSPGTTNTPETPSPTTRQTLEPTPSPEAPETPSPASPQTPDTPSPESPDTPSPVTPETPEPTPSPETPDTPSPEIPETPEPTPAPETPDTPSPEIPEFPEPTPSPETPDTTPSPEIPEPPEPTPSQESQDTPSPQTRASPEPTPAPETPDTPSPVAPETPPPETPETTVPTVVLPSEGPAQPPVIAPAVRVTQTPVIPAPEERTPDTTAPSGSPIVAASPGPTPTLSSARTPAPTSAPVEPTVAPTLAPTTTTTATPSDATTALSISPTASPTPGPLPSAAPTTIGGEESGLLGSGFVSGFLSVYGVSDDVLSWLGVEGVVRQVVCGLHQCPGGLDSVLVGDEATGQPVNRIPIVSGHRQTRSVSQRGRHPHQGVGQPNPRQRHVLRDGDGSSSLGPNRARHSRIEEGALRRWGEPARLGRRRLADLEDVAFLVPSVGGIEGADGEVMTESQQAAAFVHNVADPVVMALVAANLGVDVEDLGFARMAFYQGSAFSIEQEFDFGFAELSSVQGTDDDEDDDPGLAGSWIFGFFLVALTACALAYSCRCLECVDSGKKRLLLKWLDRSIPTQRAPTNGAIASAMKKMTIVKLSEKTEDVVDMDVDLSEDDVDYEYDAASLARSGSSRFFCYPRSLRSGELVRRSDRSNVKNVAVVPWTESIDSFYMKSDRALPRQEDEDGYESDGDSPPEGQFHFGNPMFFGGAAGNRKSLHDLAQHYAYSSSGASSSEESPRPAAGRPFSNPMFIRSSGEFEDERRLSSRSGSESEQSEAGHTEPAGRNATRVPPRYGLSFSQPTLARVGETDSVGRGESDMTPSTVSGPSESEISSRSRGRGPSDGSTRDVLSASFTIDEHERPKSRARGDGVPDAVAEHVRSGNFGDSDETSLGCEGASAGGTNVGHEAAANATTTTDAAAAGRATTGGAGMLVGASSTGMFVRPMQPLLAPTSPPGASSSSATVSRSQSLAGSLFSLDGSMGEQRESQARAMSLISLDGSMREQRESQSRAMSLITVDDSVPGERGLQPRPMSLISLDDSIPEERGLPSRDDESFLSLTRVSSVGSSICGGFEQTQRLSARLGKVERSGEEEGEQREPSRGAREEGYRHSDSTSTSQSASCRTSTAPPTSLDRDSPKTQGYRHEQQPYDSSFLAAPPVLGSMRGDHHDDKADARSVTRHSPGFWRPWAKDNPPEKTEPEQSSTAVGKEGGFALADISGIFSFWRR